MVGAAQHGINLEPITSSLADGTNALQPGPRAGIDLNSDTSASHPSLGLLGTTTGDFSELSGMMLNLTTEERRTLSEHRRLWKLLLEKAEPFDKLHTMFEMIRSGGMLLQGERGGSEDSPASHFDVLKTIYDKLCRMEYESIRDDLKEAFKDQSTHNKEYLSLFTGERPDWSYYQFLRPGYIRLGFSVPPRVLNRIDTDVTFFGRKVWHGAHPLFADLLKDAERYLRRTGEYESARREMAQKHSELSLPHFGGFVPRYQARRLRSGKYQGLRALSNHAFGLAIDIEFPTNPMLVGPSARAIDDLLDHLQKQGAGNLPRVRKQFEGWGKVSMDDYNRIKVISDVVVEFLREWIPRWEQIQQTRKKYAAHLGHWEAKIGDSSRDPQFEQQLKKDREVYFQAEHDWQSTKEYALLEKLIKAWNGIAKARFFADYGLVTIPLSVFRAMKEVGAQSGAGYRISKDTMHFEYPGHVSKVLSPVTGQARQPSR